jgi:hypothetical protein
MYKGLVTLKRKKIQMGYINLMELFKNEEIIRKNLSQ